MKKGLFPLVASTVLALTLIGAIGTAVASRGGNSGSNSGPGRGNRDRDTIIRLANSHSADAPEFILRANRLVLINNAPITRVGTSDFDVAINGITFTVQVVTGTQFLGGAVFGDLIVGRIVDVRGQVDPNNLRQVQADQIRIRMVVARGSFTLREDGQARINDAAITRLGTNEFDVAIRGITFTVRVTAATQFLGGLTFSALTVGRLVDVRGQLDAANHHLIIAERVGPGELNLRQVRFELDDED